MTTVVSNHGDLALPPDSRERDGIVAGQHFVNGPKAHGEYLLKGQAETAEAEKKELDLIDWLLACPEKDWFQPLNSESTDTLKSPFEP